MVKRNDILIMWYAHYKNFYDPTSEKWEKKDNQSRSIHLPSFNFEQESSEESEMDDLPAVVMDEDSFSDVRLY